MVVTAGGNLMNGGGVTAPLLSSSISSSSIMPSACAESHEIMVTLHAHTHTQLFNSDLCDRSRFSHYKPPILFGLVFEMILP